jgi:hypothetical protein
MSVTLSGSGQVPVQVVSTTKTDTFSTTTQSPTITTVTGLSASITPTNSANKVLVNATINIGQTDSQITYIWLLRNGSPIFIGDAAGSRPRISGTSYYSTGAGVMQYACVPYTLSFLDSPSTTSSTTYAVGIANNVSGTSFINRTGGDRDTSGYDGRSASSITVMEISG